MGPHPACTRYLRQKIPFSVPAGNRTSVVQAGQSLYWLSYPGTDSTRDRFTNGYLQRDSRYGFKLDVCDLMRGKQFYTRVYPKVSGQSRKRKYTLTTINTRWEEVKRHMVTKLTRLTHIMAIQPHLVTQNCTICSSRSRRSVRKLLDTPSYIASVTSNLKSYTLVISVIIMTLIRGTLITII